MSTGGIRSMSGLLCGLLLASPAGAERVEPRVTPSKAVTVARESRLIAPGIIATQVTLPSTVRPATLPEMPCGGEAIGYTREAPAGIGSLLHWTRTAGGDWVSHLELSSAGAEGLRFAIARAGGDERLEVRLYTPDGGAVLGPFRPALGPDRDTWWSPTGFGERVGVEFRVRGGDGTPPRPPMVTRVAYLYAAQLLTCHLDAMCYPAWANEVAGVAMIGFMCGTDPSQLCGYCTGFLLNRSAADGAPMFMTANHCVSGQAQASSAECFWFYQSASCGGTVPSPMDVPRTVGTVWLVSDQPNDCTLLGLASAPPAGSTLLGYDTGAWAVGDAITGIHHPGGSYKRISFGALTGSGILPFNFGGNIVYVSVWTVRYDQGATEPGSSGSPLFDSSHHVRGPLTGGNANCPPEGSNYGRFDLAYPNLAPFLGALPNPVWVNGGYSGFETGTSGQPFSSVQKAAICAASGAQVNLAPGTYAGGLTLYRPMTLTAPSGTVQIGH